MQIDWTAFTPGPALFGGVLLGIAAALYIHFHGRILGISGIVSGLLRLFGRHFCLTFILRR
jgi:hypothetical protein